eukprot:1147909-Pelagomonas_calceolata.AAC.3
MSSRQSTIVQQHCRPPMRLPHSPLKQGFDRLQGRPFLGKTYCAFRERLRYSKLRCNNNVGAWRHYKQEKQCASLVKFLAPAQQGGKRKAWGQSKCSLSTDGSSKGGQGQTLGNTTMYLLAFSSHRPPAHLLVNTFAFIILKGPSIKSS